MSETKHITLPIRIGYRGADIGCENAKIGGFAKLLDVRGWGYLSGRGHGALGLPQDEAAAEQDAFANLVVEAVNSFASLQEENEALKQRLSTAYRVKAECNDDANRERHLRVIVQEENEALKARIAELTAALKFYADAWCFTPNPKRAGLECKPKESLLDDCGNIARAAIANKTAEADNGRRN